MANTTSHGKGLIQIIPDGSTDWVYGTDVAASTGFPTNGMGISYIMFVPSAANDRLQIHDGGIDATLIFDSSAVTTVNTVQKSYDRKESWRRPVIDASDCTFGTPANVRIIIGYY